MNITWEPGELFPDGNWAKVRRVIERWPVPWQKSILTRKTLSGEQMPSSILKPIDYDFRPPTYWKPANLRHLVANIKGAERKKQALWLIECGRLDEAAEFILADSLSDEERAMAGQEHPALMGGEYLPDYEDTEIEIARVTMASTTQDVISIRACPGIAYRVVDEYETVFDFKPRKSRRPLPLRQLIRLIDTGTSTSMGPIGLGILQINFDCSDMAAEGLADFMDFSSQFYPDLHRHYWFAVQRWVARNSKRRRKS